MPVPTTPTNLAAAAASVAGRLNHTIALTWDVETRVIYGSITSITEFDAGNCLIETAVAHQLQVGDTIEICGSVESSYNVVHTVTTVETSKKVTTDIVHAYDELASGVHFRWQGGQQDFEIQRSPDGTGSWVTVAHGRSSNSSSAWCGDGVDFYEYRGSFTHSLLQAGSTHHYRVRARNPDGDSSWSNVATDSVPAGPGQLAAPTSLAATRTADRLGADLAWNVSVTDAKRWEIERRELSGGSWNFVYYSSTNETRTTFSDVGLDVNKEYEYRVRHRFVSGRSTNYSRWQNQHDPLDANADGVLDVNDLRLVFYWLEDKWPDGGLTTQDDLMTGGPNPGGVPGVDPPPVDTTYAPVGGYVDPNGDAIINVADRLQFDNWFAINDVFASRSEWAGPAQAYTPPASWHLFWADPNRAQVSRAWKDGKSVEDLFTGITGTQRAVDVDENTGHVYILAGNTTAGTIYRADKNGGTATEILAGEGYLGLAIDQTNRKLYWTNQTTVKRADLDGTNIETLVDVSDIPTLDTFTGIDVDPSGEKIYWCDYGKSRIHKAELDGTSVSTIVDEATTAENWDVCVDVTNSKLYYATGTIDQRIRRCNLDGSTKEDIATGQQNAYSVAVNETDSKIYWGAGPSGNAVVKQADLDGSNAATITTGCISDVYCIQTLVQGDQPPVKPYDFYLTSLDATTNRLDWESIHSEHAFVEIQRSETGNECDWKFIATLYDGNTPCRIESYVDNGLTAGKTYHYRVRSAFCGIVPNGADWQNQGNPLDVTNDGVVNLHDAQAIDDWLLQDPPRFPWGPPVFHNEHDDYLDPGGDDAVDASDSLAVANCLAKWSNASQMPSFYAEASTTGATTTTTTSSTTSTTTSTTSTSTTSSTTTSTTSTSTSTTSTSTTTSDPTDDCRYVWTRDNVNSRLEGWDSDGSDQDIMLNDYATDKTVVNSRGLASNPYKHLLYYGDLSALVGGKWRLMQINTQTDARATVLYDVGGSIIDISLDFRNGWIYYSSSGLRRCRWNGTEDQLVSASVLASSLAAAPSLERVFYVKSYDGVWYYNLANDTLTQIVTGGRPKAVAWYPTYEGGKVFFSDDTSGDIFKCGPDGSDLEVVLDRPPLAQTHLDLEIDEENGKLVYSGEGIGVRRCNLVGTGDEEVVPEPNPNGVGGNFQRIAVCQVPQPATTTTTTSTSTTSTSTTSTSTTSTSTTSTTSTTAAPTTTTSTTCVPANCQHLYWADNNGDKIRRSGFIGEAQSIVRSLGGDTGDIYVDSDNCYLYWAETETGKIRRSGLDGVDPVDLVTGRSGPQALTIDNTNSYIYWLDYVDQLVMRSDLDGSNVTQISLSETDVQNGRGLAIDIGNGKLYYHRSNTGDLMEITVLGASPTALFSSLSGGLSVVIDEPSGKLYWVDNSAGIIERGNVGGTGRETLYTSPLVSPPIDLVLDLTASKVFFLEGVSKSIKWMDLDGSNPETLFTIAGSQAPSSLGMCGDSSAVQTTTTSTTSSTTTSSTTTSTTTKAPGYCKYLYWSDYAEKIIRTANEDGGVIETLLEDPGTPLPRVTSFTVNTTAGKLVWTDTEDKALRQVGLDGSGYETLRTLAGLSGWRGVSYSEADDQLWTVDSIQGRLIRCDADGTNLTTRRTDFNKPFATAIHDSQDKVFITSDDGIHYTDKDGGGLVQIVYGNNPLGIAVKTGGTPRVYWAESGEKIQSANFDGSDIQDIVTGLEGVSYLAIDNQTGKMLWAEYDGRVIKRSTLSGGDVETVVDYSGDLAKSPYCIALCTGAGDATTTTTTSTSTTSTSTTTAAPTTTTTTSEPTTTTTTSTKAPDSINVGGAREQIAVDQTIGGGSHFPFICPSDDLEQLVADFYLYYDDPGCELEQPFNVRWFSEFGITTVDNPAGLGDKHSYDLLVEDANGTIVYDSRESTTFTITAWGTDKKILEWANGTDCRGEVLRVVIFSAWPPDATVINWPTYFEPTDSRLDPRALQPIPPKVCQLEIEYTDEDGDQVVEAIKVGVDVLFSQGYNTELTEDTGDQVDGLPLISSFEVDATPGNGLGRYPGCNEDLVIRRINDVIANDRGNMSVDAKGCYRVQPVITGTRDPNASGMPIVELMPAALKVTNDCGACCECDDFIRVYEGIRRLWMRYKKLGDRAERVRDLYKANLERWEQNRACRLPTTLRYAFIKVPPCQLGFAGGLCNTSQEKLLNVKVHFNFEGATQVGCILCDSAMRKGNVDSNAALHDPPPSVWQPYKLEGDWPNYTAHFDCISPGTLGQVTFKLDFPGGNESDQICVKITASGEGTANVPAVEGCSGLKCEVDEDCCETSEQAAQDQAPQQLTDNESGAVSRVSRHTETGTTIVTTAGSHNLATGDSITILGNSVSDYNATHAVLEYLSSNQIRTDKVYTTDGVGGTWSEN